MFDVKSYGFLEEDHRQLLMRKGQGPETEVGGGMRDGSEHVLDGFDGLVDHDLTESRIRFTKRILEQKKN